MGEERMGGQFCHGFPYYQKMRVLWIPMHHGNCGCMHCSSCLLSLISEFRGINLCRPMLENRNDPFGCNLHPLYEMQSHLNPRPLPMPIMHRHERNKSSFIYGGQHLSTHMWLDGSSSLASQSAYKEAIGNLFRGNFHTQYLIKFQ